MTPQEVMPREPNSANGHAAGADEPPSHFWHDPAGLKDREIAWYHPPVPVRQAHASRTEALLDRLVALVGESARRSWLARWTYHERARAAAAEMEEVEREARVEWDALRAHAEARRDELDEDLSALRDRRRQTQETLREAHEQFAEAAARAGLAVSAEGVTPARVQEALLDTAPGLTEIAGANGVAPVEDPQWTLGGIVKALFLFLAPWAAGFMLALCLGTLVGLLDLSVLRQPGQNAGRIILAALLGFVIVYLLGEVISAAITTWARSQEAAAAEDVPRYRYGARMAIILITVALMLVAAEVTAEMFGIRQLHEQHIVMLQRSAGGSVAAEEGGRMLPLAIYALIGLLISGPYVAYKAVSTWMREETQAREAWLLKRQRDWLDAKWSTEAVQATYRLAHVIHRQETEAATLDARQKEARDEREAWLQADVSPQTRARRAAARAAAVGEAARLHDMVEALVAEGDENNAAPPAAPERAARPAPSLTAHPEYPERV